MKDHSPFECLRISCQGSPKDTGELMRVQVPSSGPVLLSSRMGGAKRNPSLGALTSMGFANGSTIIRAAAACAQTRGSTIQMPLYDFPLWAGDFVRFPTAGFRGAGWNLMAAEVPYARYGSKALERHFETMRKKYSQYSVHNVGNGDDAWIAPQIIAEAKSRLAAQKAFQLLTAALTILDGNDLFDVDDGVVIPRNRNRLEDLTASDIQGSGHTVSRDNVIFGCKLAAQLSRQRFLTYSGFKLKLSYKIASAHWMEFHPLYSPKSFSVSDSPFDHVRMASAITLAYSAIEELQLEPRPIRNKPVKTEAGWDEVARADLHGRLQAAGVDIGEPLGWARRGSQTRVHKSKRAALGAKQPWTKGTVRDAAVAIDDALLEASWLRSKCTTHKYQKATSSISMYDVSNIQLLARRLLLETVGLWKPLLHLELR